VSPLVIQLPPMSQIQMSQVEALPPELQQQVLSRMKKAGACGTVEGDFGDNRTREKQDTCIELLEEEYTETNSIVLSTPQSTRHVGNQREIIDLEGEAFGNNESPLVIQLPPMSQIQMSQVEALPQELQQQIISRMNETAIDVAADGVEVIDETQPGNNHVHARQEVVAMGQQNQANHRYRQTDLKRMMKLAAVRSGHERAGISLTQLEQLPLEIKLQVVNHDNRQVGVLSPHVSRTATNFSDRQPRKSTSSSGTGISLNDSHANTKKTTSRHHNNHSERRKKTTDTNTTILNPRTTTKKKELKGAQQRPRKKFRIIDRVDVWKEDLVPLKQFLGENCPLNHPDSVDKVIEFLSIVLKEGRLPAMVTMIRCIRNRQDDWSEIEIIRRIAQTMNRLHRERYGTCLDVGWLMGTGHRR